MTKYRQKLNIEASQWFKNGDHPLDDIREFELGDYPYGYADTEGKIVRYYRNPDEDPQRECQICHEVMHDHGWIDRPHGGITVCPGDYVITDPVTGYYAMPKHSFELLYEKLE